VRSRSSLIGEGLDEGNLLGREGPDLQVIDIYDAQQVIAFEDRHHEHRPHGLDGLHPVRVFRIGRNIRIVDRSAFERGSTGNAVPIEANWICALQSP
jgi:hypothetical protein